MIKDTRDEATIKANEERRKEAEAIAFIREHEDNHEDDLYEPIDTDTNPTQDEDKRVDRTLIAHAGTPTISADNFLRRRDAPLRYWRGDFYNWTGTHYSKIDKEMLKSEVSNHLEMCETPDGEQFFPKIKTIDEVLAALCNRTIIASTREAYTYQSGQKMSGMMVCRNGLLDIMSGELKPHDPNCLVFNCLPFDYKSDMPPPQKWLQFLKELFPTDKREIAALQEEMGYIFSGMTELQKIFLLIGGKRSGKGTIIRVIQHIMGKDNCTSTGLGQLASRFGLQSAIGKSLLTVPDARTSYRRGENAAIMVERLLNISGEDWVNVERKNRVDWEGQLMTRIIIVSNEVPKFPDPSGVVPSRFIPISFKESFFGREDLKLMDKLLPEAASILAWSLEGLRRLLERGQFIIPDTSDELMREVELSATPMLSFIDECIIEEPGHKELKDSVYDVYVQWCAKTGHKASNNVHFSIELRSLLDLTDDRATLSNKEVTLSNKEVTLSKSKKKMVWNDIKVIYPNVHKSFTRIE